MTEFEIKTHFERRLTELGLSFTQTGIGHYILINDCNTQQTHIQFIVSEHVKETNSISINGNVIQLIGHFKLEHIKDLANIDFYIMAFHNPDDQNLDYIVIPTNELQRRIKSVNPSQSYKKTLELIFWIMPDGSLYETNGISPEGEWYFISKGINGRMADKTDWCYTLFLNNWQQLI